MFDPRECYDAAVFGGGLCGFAAAQGLARRGARVVLVARRPVLGWETTWAFHTELGEPRGETGRWLAEAMAARGGCREGRLDPPIAELVLDREAAEAGVEVLLYAQPVAVGQQDGRVTDVLLGTKSGELAVRARAFVDATENTLLWRLAGGQARPPADPVGAYTAFVNNVSPEEVGPDLVSLRADGGKEVHASLGDVPEAWSVTVHSTLWPGEVAVRYAVPSLEVGVARRALPGVLEAVRNVLGGPPSALVTATGADLLPLASWEVDAEAEGMPSNLFPAAPWAVEDAEPGSLGDRLAVGDAAAEAVMEMLRGEGVSRKDAKTPRGKDADGRPGELGRRGRITRHASRVTGAVAGHSQVAPPAHEADVVVCGGGTGGAVAAIAAARQGSRSVLLEAGTGLGGVGTGGGIHSYYHGVAGGLQDEVDARLAELAPLFGPRGKVQGFHPWAKQVVLEQMAHEAGVQVVYGTAVTGGRTEPVPSELPARADEHAEPVRRLTAVVAAGPEGNALYQAKAFVDGTGDGDVAALAGASFTFGRATDGLPHAYSLPAGRLGEDGKLLITNFDAGYCDPTDAVDLTRARRRALQHYGTERFDAASRLLYIAPVLGLRNSRLVEGDVVITLADEVAGRQFPDVVAYATSHFDNHGFDFENESDEAMLWVWVLGHWGRRIGCEVPYRALLPRGIEGLLMGCRALSMTHDAHNQLRMQRDLQRVGEAAGIAAALAAARGLTPRQLPVADLQAELVRTGALGKPEPRRLPAPAQAVDIHDTSWVPLRCPQRPAADWIEHLGGANSPDAAWELLRQGEAALPALRGAARAEEPATRLWASVVLAMLRQPEAAPELRACLVERRDLPREGRKAAPLWQGAIVLLGRLGDAAALPELCRVLEDRQAPLDALIAALRALGRIGDPSAVPAIEAMLRRPDLPHERRLQVSVAAVGEVVEDARWQIDLAAAETLARLGRARPDLLEPHLRDERALVRRYAQRVADEMAQD